MPAALVLDREAALHLLQRRFRVLAAERRRFLIIRLRRRRIRGTADARLRELPRGHHRRHMALRRRALEQRACAGLVLRAARAFGHHHAELVLRLGRRVRRLRQQRTRARRIGGRAAAVPERRQIADAARVARIRRTLEQVARLAHVLRDTRAVGVDHAEIDHRRRAALVRRLAIGGDRIRHLPVRLVSAAELIHRTARAVRRHLAILDRDGDVRRRDGARTGNVLRLVGIVRVRGDAVAQHEIGGLCVGGSGRRQQHNTANDRKHAEPDCHEVIIAHGRASGCLTSRHPWRIRGSARPKIHTRITKAVTQCPCSRCRFPSSIRC